MQLDRVEVTRYFNQTFSFTPVRNKLREDGVLVSIPMDIVTVRDCTINVYSTVFKRNTFTYRMKAYAIQQRNEHGMGPLNVDTPILISASMGDEDDNLSMDMDFIVNNLDHPTLPDIFRNKLTNVLLTGSHWDNSNYVTFHDITGEGVANPNWNPIYLETEMRYLFPLKAVMTNMFYPREKVEFTTGNQDKELAEKLSKVLSSPYFCGDETSLIDTKKYFSKALYRKRDEKVATETEIDE